MKLIEIQKTFYDPPMVKTALKWRREAPTDFEFTVKAWQLITHPASSPTYRKVKIPGKKENYGFFKNTREVFEAYERTVSIARALKAAIIVFQTPPQFKEGEGNIQNVRNFFTSLSSEFLYVWESRGNWNPDTLKKLCEELNLIDGTDPFRRKPVTERQYFRLHGSPPGETMYSYTYTDKDLTNLHSFCRNGTYVLFNNVTMFEDALRFAARIWGNGAAEI